MELKKTIILNEFNFKETCLIFLGAQQHKSNNTNREGHANHNFFEGSLYTKLIFYWNIVRMLYVTKHLHQENKLENAKEKMFTNE